MGDWNRIRISYNRDVRSFPAVISLRMAAGFVSVSIEDSCNAGALRACLELREVAG
jgi:hypothetical protein